MRPRPTKSSLVIFLPLRFVHNIHYATFYMVDMVDTDHPLMIQ